MVNAAPVIPLTGLQSVFRLGVAESTVSHTLVRWINNLYLSLGLSPIWPSWENVEATRLHASRNPAQSIFAYKNYFAIKDKGVRCTCSICPCLSQTTLITHGHGGAAPERRGCLSGLSGPIHADVNQPHAHQHTSPLVNVRTRSQGHGVAQRLYP